MACLVSALSSPVLMNMWYPLSSLHQSWSQVLQPHCRERPSVSELKAPSRVRLVRVPGPALSPLYHGASHLEAFQGFGADALNRLPEWPQTEDAGGEPGSLGPLLVQVGHPFAAHISVKNLESAIHQLWVALALGTLRWIGQARVSSCVASPLGALRDRPCLLNQNPRIIGTHFLQSSCTTDCSEDWSEVI